MRTYSCLVFNKKKANIFSCLIFSKKKANVFSFFFLTNNLVSKY